VEDNYWDVILMEGNVDFVKEVLGSERIETPLEPITAYSLYPLLSGTSSPCEVRFRDLKDIYIRPKILDPVIQLLQTQMRDFYKKNKDEVLRNDRSYFDISNLNNSVAVLDNQLDGIFYRVEVLDRVNVDQVEAMFIDFGMFETLDVSGLRPIHPSMMQVGAMSFQCVLRG
ncbi:unnamed protein product, partial [Cyprideis torosa]